jgi:Family of unknown function (DUF6677)
MPKQVMFAESDDEVIEINLKDPWLAAFLAWLVPGLGHLYQGRTGKGLLFFVCIVGTFLYGLYIGDGRVVYAASANVFSREFLNRWQYICQLGVGLPALPAYIQARRAAFGKPPLLADLMRPPVMKPGYTSTDDSNHEVMHPDELAKWHHDLSDRFEIGTVFTVIAGLLNVLVIFDAYGGPLVIPAQPDKKRADEEKNDQ